MTMILTKHSQIKPDHGLFCIRQFYNKKGIIYCIKKKREKMRLDRFQENVQHTMSYGNHPHISLKIHVAFVIIRFLLRTKRALSISISAMF